MLTVHLNFVTEEQPLLKNWTARRGRRQTSIEYELIRDKLILKPSRSVIVEPLAALAAVSSSPFTQLYQEYIYHRFYLQMAEQTGVNVTGPVVDSQSNCLQYHNNSWSNETVDDLIEPTQAATANFVIYLSIATAVPACITTPLITAYSDQRGRKYALVPPMVGLFCRTLIYFLTALFQWPLWCLIIGNVIDGLTGDFTTLLSACLAYISDTTTRNKRAFRVTMLLSCSMIPMVVIPFVFGYLVRETGFLVPFLCVVILQTTGLLYAIFLIPETIARPFDATFWAFSHVKDTLHVFFYDREPNGRRGSLCVLLLTGTIAYCLINVSVQILTLFQLNKPLCWDSVLVGIFLAVHMAVGGIGQVLGVRCLKLCLPELVICVLSAFCMALQNVYFGFVQTTTMMFLGKAVMFKL